MRSEIPSPTLEQMAAVFGYELKGRAISADEAAALRCIKKNTQEHERTNGTGPRYFRQGGKVVYSERDVLEWMIAGARRSTAENRPRSRLTTVV
jgi:hypothetical protein